MNAYVFDVDGVLTNLVTKKLEQSEFFSIILKLLSHENLVAFNTGRSLDWMRKMVINPLHMHAHQKTIFSKLYTVTEMGGTWLDYNTIGNSRHFIDKSIVVPIELKQEIHQLVDSKYKDSMFYDPKDTMITIEMNAGFSIEQFSQIQKILNLELESLIKKFDLEQALRMETNIICTNIVNKHAGKDYAAEKILTWIGNYNHKPEKIITFGDSLLDIKMTEVFFTKGFNTEFVYVGLEEIHQKGYPFKITKTLHKNELGTLEYLTNYI